MSEDTNTSIVIDFSKLTLERDAVQNERFYNIRDGKVLVTETQITREKSDYKGFSYYKPVFKDVGEALKQFGDEVLLDLFNAKLAAMIAIRVAARIEAALPERDLGDEKATPPRAAEPVEAFEARRKAALQELLLKSPVIFTPEDALAYQPGERELSISGLIRKIGKIVEAGQNCYKAGQLEEGGKLFAQVAELNVRLGKMMQEARDKAISVAGETE